MPVRPNPRGRHDDQRIALDQLPHWAARFSVSPDQVRDAVKAVGAQADAVAEYLRAHNVEAH